MIPKEDADTVNLWRAGETLNNAFVLVANVGKPRENKRTTSELW